MEVYVQCPIEICKQRDPKGLYHKAETGQIYHFTGVSAPYEPPLTPELIIPTHQLGVEECAERIFSSFLSTINRL
ncbi:adenylyl-sulfate kinase [Brevibacillus fortis]|uniref:adenylyl-sulfate kinase n=1 Tax=Brevibacillus fortis TaxID=2126352 RepID=UPI002E22B452|nr:adenylyl-sulfate kinase [Brevibacillus fortis]